MKDENKLFEYFGVTNDKELLEFVKNNPTDPKSKEYLEILELFKRKEGKK